jgi:protein involved in polysaccharide export with SLBB domain
MLTHLKATIVALGALLCLVAICPAQTQSAGTKPDTGQAPVSATSYRLKPEDTVTVFVQDAPEASADYLIRRDGYITVGMRIGDVKAAGLTVQELTDTLKRLLKKQVLDPKVTINVKAQSEDRFYIMGAVRQQGVFDCKPKWRLTEAIAAAGGLSSAPERSKLVLWRIGEQNQTVDLKRLLIQADQSQDLEIRPGDVLNVQSDVTVRLQAVGEIKKPGVIEVLDGQGVAEALSAAGGIDPEAKLSEAKIVRGGKEIPVDLYKIAVKGHPELNIPVQENDTLYIPQNQNRVSVIGSVSKPGPVPLIDGRDTYLTDAISLAGGFTVGAVRGGVTLVRKDANGKSTSKNYDVAKIIKQKKAKLDDPVLQDGDIIYVAESGKPRTSDLGAVFGTLSLVRWFIP